MHTITIRKFGKISKMKFVNSISFFKEKGNKLLKYREKDYLFQFRKYVKENRGWVFNCKNRYFRTNLEIKCLMCYFIKNFLNLCKRKEEQFNPFPSNLLFDEEVFFIQRIVCKI